mgnify:CR=1 FL=1
MKVPFTNLTLQTSDFAKVALVLWIAKELHFRKDRLDDFKGEVTPILIRIGLVCGLILPADFSTAALLGLVALSMLFIGGVPFKGLIKILGLIIISGISIYGVSEIAPDLVPRSKTWVNRVEQFVGFNGYRISDMMQFDKSIKPQDVIPYTYPTKEELKIVTEIAPI